MNEAPRLPESLRAALEGMGFLAAGEPLAAAPLTGGVASDIWRVQLPDRTVCVKQALSQLKVAQLWEVPVERNAYEVAWFETAGAIAPTAVPDILGHDAGLGVFVMEYLNPRDYRLWKNQLRDGVVEETTAVRVGRALVSIHSGTAQREEVARRFATDELFFALRPEPYLLASAEKHPQLARRLAALVDSLMANKKALVHGDVSPKNILVGPAGPVFLDAECAWYGDPAFDLAFCLNHLLLKCLWKPAHTAAYLRALEVLAGDYLAGVDWEEPAHLEQRVAHLLPGLLLARVDGKSPVEYVTADADRQRVRDFSGRFLLEPVAEVAELADAWRHRLAAPPA